MRSVSASDVFLDIRLVSQFLLRFFCHVKKATQHIFIGRRRSKKGGPKGPSIGEKMDEEKHTTPRIRWLSPIRLLVAALRSLFCRVPRGIRLVIIPAL